MRLSLRTLAIPIILFTSSLVVNFFAGIYATERASSPVGDLVLSNIPVFDVEFLFIWGSVLLVLAVIALCIRQPASIPFVLNSFSIFYLVRSVFVTLTHIGPFPTRVMLDASQIAAKMFGGADLFFSEHTGAPFLLALIFWNNTGLRFFFLAWSVFFAVIVLLGHLHYSIDVLAAFFITYGIYHIALYLFPNQHRWLTAVDIK